MKGVVVVVLTLVAVLGPAVSSADNVVVDWDGAMPPYISKLQDGIDAVSDGATVYVTASLSYAADSLRFRGPRNRGLDFGGKNITLQTLGGPQFVIDCEGLDRAILLSAANDSTTHITGLTFMNGYAPDGGGAIKCEGDSPHISDCAFHRNASTDGGALLLSQGPTRITRCEFFKNSASGNGGAIHAADSDITMTACTFGDNSALGGGGISLINSNLTVERCTLANNEAATGGAVWFQSARGGRVSVIEQCVLAFSRLGKSVVGGTAEIFHCCVFGNEGGNDLPGSPHDNLFEEPLICGLYGEGGGNMSLCSNSPCLPSGNTWELHIGSKEQGCLDCDSPVEASSWGSIKALFR